MKLENLSAPFVPKLLERFLDYTKRWTTSDSAIADQGIMPSSEGQKDFANSLVKNLQDLGISDVRVSDNFYVYAKIPSSEGCEKIPSIGFLAHLDTTEEVSGKNVNPQIIENYDGNKIYLKENVVLDPTLDLELSDAIGDTIITTDGTTLLGADDKAGIAIIMTAIDVLLKNKEIKHGPLEIIFSPDEETGHGMDKVPLEWISSKFCYTVDGGNAGEIESECFNAWKSEIIFTGKAKHTGTARPDMVNAITMASDFITSLPKHESPETTDGYQGFYAPMEISGHIEKAYVTLFLRDFEQDGMKRRKSFVESLAKMIEEKYVGSNVVVNHTQQYLNMKEGIAKNPEIMEKLVNAVKHSGLQPVFKPIRGGTDGSRLTELGIPCPNIFTGGHNFHSKREWASLSQMVYGVLTLLNLVTVKTDNEIIK